MDEHFTIDPATTGGRLNGLWPDSHSAEKVAQIALMEQVNAYTAFTSLAKALLICALVWVLLTVASFVPVVAGGWTKFINGGKVCFGNKEGLLYTGALANQLRDDTPFAQDSLAEQAAAAQEAATAQAKAQFRSRENLIHSPEEELKKSFK